MGASPRPRWWVRGTGPARIAGPGSLPARLRKPKGPAPRPGPPIRRYSAVMPTAIARTELDGLRLLHRGKVRDLYEVDASHLLLVATDRISAFDHVLPDPIPGKGVDPHAAFDLLVRALAGARRAPRRRVRRPEDAGRGRGARRRAPRARAAREAREGLAVRVHRARVPARQRLEGLPADRRRLRHPPARRPAQEPRVPPAALHAVDEGRDRPRRERVVRDDGGEPRAEASRPSCATDAHGVRPLREPREEPRRRHLRHEARMGRDRRPHDPDRRGPDAGLEPLLEEGGGRRGPPRRRSAFIRQAGRARLARDAALGQEVAASAPAGRGRRARARPVRRDLRTDHGTPGPDGSTRDGRRDGFSDPLARGRRRHRSSCSTRPACRGRA